MARTIDELKEKGVWIVGTDAKGKEDYRQMDGKMPLGLVIGSEGKGMGRLVRDKCDFLIQLTNGWSCDLFKCFSCRGSTYV